MIILVLWKMLSLLLFLLRIVNTLELKENEEDKNMTQNLSNVTTVHALEKNTSDLFVMQNMSIILNVTRKSNIDMPALDINQSNSENNNKSIIEDDLDIISKSKNPCPTQSLKCSKYFEKDDASNIKTIKQTSEEISLGFKENDDDSKIYQKIPNKSENDPSSLIETSPNTDRSNITNKINSEASRFDNETEVIEEQQSNPISLEILDREFTLVDDLSNKSLNPKEKDESLKSVNLENDSQNTSQEVRHKNEESSDISPIPFITDEHQQPNTTVMNDSDDLISILDIVPFNQTGFQASTPSIPIRKCCESHQFFSLTTHVCENSTHDPMFIENAKQLINDNNSNNITLVPGRITECPVTNSGPRVVSVDALTHSLSSLGILHHLESDKKYDLDRYCVEMATYNAEEISSATMLVAFCPYETLVRKCCDSEEFFNIATGQCEVSEQNNEFERQTDFLLETNALKTIELETGQIKVCPFYDEELRIFGGVTNLTHSINSAGHLIEKETMLEFEHQQYCLDMVAFENGDTKLTAALCTKKVVKIRKCCELDQYFDTDLNDCIARPHMMSTHEHLVEAITFEVFSHESFIITTARLKCPGVPIEIRDLNEFYLDEGTGDLCEIETHFCYPLSNYCIEDFSSKSEENVNHKAEICPSNYFNKCCSMGQKISDYGCIDSYDQPSLYMEELSLTMKAAFGFPQKLGCTPFPLGTAYESNHTEHFFVTYLGLLSLTFDDVEFTTTNYCIDDLLDSTNTTHLYATVCEEEIYPDHPTPASLNNLPAGTIGKCCPPGHHTVIENIVDKTTGKIINKISNCEKDDIYLDIIADPKIIDANITNITFTLFPQCDFGKGHHVYELSSMDEKEENFLDKSQNLILLNKYGKCIKDETLVNKDRYCLDYLSEGSDMKPVAIVCQANYHNIEIQHEEKHSIMAVFLGISCATLIATAASLVSTRVRRGLVTVKKVNTLAGRILLSYVLSYLFGFLTLAVAHKANPEHEDGIEGCRAIAGIIMFFMLSAFHWNTSICLESLLLTLRVSTSEGRRYLLHSLWAWGIPGFITALALSLDAYKESLPCGTITPEIGVYRCFFSDIRAQLLYFYLPMFITLVANLGLLLAARAVRVNNLRKLEHGPNRKKKGNAVESTELQGRGQVTDADTKKGKQAAQKKEPNAPQSHGMRIHQNRNLWLEAVKLVMWSGVTLSIEVISYFVFRFSNREVGAESWYEYLWYIPSIVNSLRGFGIFVILVLTEENRKKFAKALGTLSFLPGGAGSSPRQTHSVYSSDDSTVGNSSYGGHGKRRNMSVTTTITQISSIRNKFTGNGNISSNPCSDSTSPHQQLAKSVSQIGRQGSFSSESDFEGKEVDSDGSKRRPSLAVVGITPLESVDEEDVIDQQIISKDTFNNTNNLSFA